MGYFFNQIPLKLNQIHLLFTQTYIYPLGEYIQPFNPIQMEDTNFGGSY
jgi:hypothetical protein